MTEVVLRTYDGKKKRVYSVYLSVPPILKKIEEELKRLGYDGEILCYRGLECLSIRNVSFQARKKYD